jgi:hexosaminidase
VDKGLAAAVYTQTTDCEVETNGLMTYDRAVIKLDPQVYADLNRGLIPPQFLDTRESFLHKTAVELWLRNPNADIVYTTDGTEPTRSSKRYTAPIRIDSTVTIRARSVLPNGQRSVVVSKRYKKLSTYKRAANPTIAQQGLKCDYYAGHWTKLPDFSQLKPVRASIVPKMNLAWVADVKQDFALRFTGFIRIPHTDVYSFFTHSDDGSRLTIADQVVVDNDGVHGMAEKSGEIALGAGWHPIELVYFQGGGGLGLRVGFTGAGFDRMLIPADILGCE